MNGFLLTRLADHRLTYGRKLIFTPTKAFLQTPDYNFLSISRTCSV